MSCPWHGDSGCFPTYVGGSDDFDPTDYGEEDEEAKEETTKSRAIVENKTEIKEEAQKTKKARYTATSASHHDAAGLWRQPQPDPIPDPGVQDMKARDTTSASHHDAADLGRQPQPDPGVQDIRRCRAKCPECDVGECMHDHGHEQRGVAHRCDMCNYMDDKVKWYYYHYYKEASASSGGDLAGLWRQPPPHEDASSKQRLVSAKKS